MPGEILFSQDAGVATLTLSNPAKLNAVDADMWRALEQHMRTLNANPELRCVLLRGAGDKAFAAGGDIEEFITVRATVDHALHYHEGLVAAALDAVRACPVPTMAMIQGACIGGGLEIAGCCDMRIAGESSRFGAPINKLGFSMYPGEMAGLLELVGPAVLLEILLEGRILSRPRGPRQGAADPRGRRRGGRARSPRHGRPHPAGAPLVARWHKQWVHRLTRGRPLSPEEKRAAFDFLATDDYKEGLDAFLAKRTPVFKGR
jgi:enoyl-CoA hydratase